MRYGRRPLLIGAIAAVAAIGVAGACFGQVQGKCMYNDYPLACTDNLGCSGATTHMITVHSGNCSGTPNGSWNFAGTRYDGAGHTVNGLYPKLRVWEFNRFMGFNSGCQNMAGSTTWYRSGRDLGCTGYDSHWYSVQNCGCGPGFDGAVSTTSGTRLVIEFSEDGWYLVMSVAKTIFVNLSDVRGGGGANGNEIPVNTIPPIASAGFVRSEGAFDIVSLTLPATPPYYTDSVGPLLIDGAGIRYIHWNETPTTHDPTQYEGWASDPASPDDAHPFVIPWGATTEVALKKPPAGLATYVAVMLHYNDWSVADAGNPTDFLGSWTTSEARGVFPTTQGIKLWAYRGGANVQLLWYSSELPPLPVTVTRAETPLEPGTVLYEGTAQGLADLGACDAACSYYYKVE